MTDLSAYQKGMESELKARDALVILCEQGVIRSFRQTKKYSKADRNGVDFFLFFDDRDRMPLQVKSSFKARENHYHYTHGARRPIPCVVGRGCERHLAYIIHKEIIQYFKDADNGNAVR